MEVEVGSIVRISGLKNRPDLNGTIAVVLKENEEEKEDLLQNGRIKVTGSPKPFSIQRANLNPIDVLNELKIQIQDGFKRRKDENVRSTFDSHKKNEVISESSLRAALKDLGIDVLEKDISELLMSSDDGSLDFNEFSLLVSRSSPGLDFVRSLPLAELVFDGLPKMELRHLCEISPDVLEDSLLAITEGLRMMLQESLAALKKSYVDREAAASNPAAAKFEIIKMSVGSIQDFHKGIAARIGANVYLCILTWNMLTFAVNRGWAAPRL